ncbi:MAG: alkaline phosphatase family protein, partial [Deltaproteobacteria bacterium]|nr:alkaline phosphatase family protein [Deltaproteobacteria bacterium]
MNRREFLKKATALGIGGALYPLQHALGKPSRRKFKMLVLGIDGMDLHLTQVYMQKGVLPNFSRLAAIGGLRAVSSSFPPQSPVAWSDFSIGATSQTHGIYDFIHRDPATMLPFHSTSRVEGPASTVSFGRLKIPLAAGKVELLRKERPFWEYLHDHDIPATVFKMPANFPCPNEDIRMVSGMGTPDLRGGYGSFTLLTSAPNYPVEQVNGGLVVPLKFEDQKATARLAGPKNTLRVDEPDTFIPVTIWRDPSNNVARIQIQGRQFLLKSGEWTDWIPLSFTMIPHLSDVKGICRIYIKSIHPDFRMYVSPINIDPSDPSLPIISSENYRRELERNIGYFYTQGLPADTKALSSGVLDDGEYFELEQQILAERNRMLNHELSRFEKQDTAFLFFYFSSLDQNAHMFWRIHDRGHPLFDENSKSLPGNAIMHMYMAMDKMLGDVMDRLDVRDPNFRLLVMSDHGFAPFRRQVNVNTWLYENGYIDLKKNEPREANHYFDKVNWNKTLAYSVGINALYLNLRGREKFGIMSPSRASQFLDKIRQELLDLRDPATGRQAVSSIRTVPARVRRDDPLAPDLIIGWSRGYRTSWDSVLGGFAPQVFSDNSDKWSGDHCIDPALVPAVLFSNQPVQKARPALVDITATILAEYGVA